MIHLSAPPRTTYRIKNIKVCSHSPFNSGPEKKTLASKTPVQVPRRQGDIATGRIEGFVLFLRTERQPKLAGHFPFLGSSFVLSCPPLCFTVSLFVSSQFINNVQPHLFSCFPSCLISSISRSLLFFPSSSSHLPIHPITLHPSGVSAGP